MAANAAPGASEQAAMRQIRAGLAKQFPDLSAEEIDRAVTGHYDAFNDSPIRDFVPVLVERAARQHLTDDHR